MFIFLVFISLAVVFCVIINAFKRKNGNKGSEKQNEKKNKENKLKESKTIMEFLRENLKENPVIKVEMDYTNTTWQNNETYKSFCGDSYDERVILSRDAFIETFNKTNKDIVLSDSNGNNKYYIIVQVNNLARRVSLKKIGAPQIKVQIEGIVKVVDISTNNAVKWMNFNLMGQENQAPSMRLSNSFELLAQKFALS